METWSALTIWTTQRMQAKLPHSSRSRLGIRSWLHIFILLPSHSLLVKHTGLWSKQYFLALLSCVLFSLFDLLQPLIMGNSGEGLENICWRLRQYLAASSSFVIIGNRNVYIRMRECYYLVLIYLPYYQ